MKKVEAIQRWENGEVSCVGTFLLCKKEAVPYMDKTTKQRVTFDKVEFSILTAGGVVFVQPDTRKIPGFKLETFSVPFKQGDKVLVCVQSIDLQLGQTVIKGTLQPLE